jgi:NAD(P)-dependent dehydrogenase (short-subunit alcohol dehydrogenase family)
LFIETDVSRDDSVANLAEATKKQYGQVDVLVNNAGISKWCDITAADALSTFDMILGVNLRGAYSVTKQLLPLMTQNQVPGLYITCEPRKQ